MRRFLKRGTAFASGGLLILALLYLFGESVSPVYYASYEKRTVLDRQGSHAALLTVGHSHNLAIDFDALGRTGVHNWYGGNDLREAFYLLRRSVPKRTAPEVVFVPVSFFAHDNAAIGGGRNEIRRETYATFLFPKLIGRDWSNLIQSKIVRPIARDDHWEHVVRRAVGQRPANVEHDVNVWIEDAEYKGYMTVEELQEHAQKRSSMHRSAEETSKQERPRHCAEQRMLLKSITAYIQPHARLVFYTPPFTRQYHEAMSGFRGCDLPEAASRLAQRFTHVDYVNAARHPSFVDTPAYFKDSDHLSRYGAAAFSTFLRDSLDLALQQEPDSASFP